MKISDASQRADLPVKTVRYYADIGLVAPSDRAANGYRDYSDRSVRQLIFVRRARAFGFSIEECRELLELYDDRNRNSSDVKEIAAKRLQQIKDKQIELARLHDELEHLVECCNGDARPDCPILDYLG